MYRGSTQIERNHMPNKSIRRIATAVLLAISVTSQTPSVASTAKPTVPAAKQEGQLTPIGRFNHNVDILVRRTPISMTAEVGISGTSGLYRATFLVTLDLTQASKILLEQVNTYLAQTECRGLSVSDARIRADDGGRLHISATVHI